MHAKLHLLIDSTHSLLDGDGHKFHGGGMLCALLCAPEPDGGWSEPNPEDTTQVDSINDMRAQRAAHKAKIEQMAEELHNK